MSAEENSELPNGGAVDGVLREFGVTDCFNNLHYETTRIADAIDANDPDASRYVGALAPDFSSLLRAVSALARALAEVRAEVSQLQRQARTRPDYDLRCQQCGAPHWLDTSLPSAIWNQIADPSDLLCMLCIDERLTAKGLRAEAEFYFVGSSLTSRLYNDSHGDVQSLSRQLAEARGELKAEKSLREAQLSDVARELGIAHAELSALTAQLAAVAKENSDFSMERLHMLAQRYNSANKRDNRDRESIAYYAVLDFLDAAKQWGPQDA